MGNTRSLNPVGAISDRWQDLKYTQCFRNRNSFAVLQPWREGEGGGRGGGGIQIVSNVDVYSSFGSPSMIQEQRLAVWPGFITRRYARCLFELNWDNGPWCDHGATGTSVTTVIACKFLIMDSWASNSSLDGFIDDGFFALRIYIIRMIWDWSLTRYEIDIYIIICCRSIFDSIFTIISKFFFHEQRGSDWLRFLHFLNILLWISKRLIVGVKRWKRKFTPRVFT